MNRLSTDQASGGNPADYLASQSHVVRFNAQTKPVIEAAAAAGRAERVEREAKFLAAREERRATIAQKTPEWEAQLAALAAQIPAGALPVQVQRRGEFLDYSVAAGEGVSGVEVTILGWVRFLGDGECGFIDQPQPVAFITPEKLAAGRREAAEKAARIAASAEAKRIEAEAKRADRAAKFEESRLTGKPVQVDRWTETRRVREGGEWGEYTFICSRFALPDGTTKETSINTY